MLQRNIVFGLVAGVLIVAAFHFLIGLSFKLLWNSLVGVTVLYLVNMTGLISVEITFLHALIVGAFGVPGFLFVVLYPRLIK